MTTASALLVFIVSAFFYSGPARAQTSINIDDKTSYLDISPLVQVGMSPPETLSPEAVQFHKLLQPEVRQGYSPLDLWIKVLIKNTSSLPLNKVLYMDSPLSGRLMLFKQGETSQPVESGPGLPLSQRARDTRLGSFNLSLAPQEEALYYLRRDSHHALNTHLIVGDANILEKQEDLVRSIFFFYIGGILSLVIYNFVIGLFATQKDHLIYALFAASFGVTAMVLHGVFDTYLLPNSHVVFSNYLMLLSSLTLFTATLFVERFLNIRRDFAFGYWGLRTLRALSLVSLCAGFFAPQVRALFIFGYWIDIAIAAGILFFLFCGIHTLRKRNYILAYFFLLSWFVILIGTSVWMAALHGLIPLSPFTQYSLLFANLGEMLVLSLGLAYKIKTLDDEKRAALLAAEEKERYHRLVKVLSHDVANAVSGMLFHTEAIQELATDSPLSDHAMRIAKTTAHLDDILKSVREEELFHSFKSHSELRPVNLQEACLTAVKYFSWELKEKNIRVEIDVPPSLNVRAERSALVNQVLANLLSNAIKFSDSGGTISLLGETRGAETILAIHDEGVGILAEDLPHLFKGTKLFTSKGTANERGSGLGSSLIGEYMKIFGGRIQVESLHRSTNAKSGTTVTLIFPEGH